MQLIIFLILACMIPQDNISVIYDCEAEKNVKDWYIVNDGVMGGLSKGQISLNKHSHALFEGFVTTENNGGFTSVRYPFKRKDVSEFESVKIRVKGDGKRYQFRIKESEEQRYSYIKEFETSGEWETISIPFNSFYPSFRGRKLDRPNYNGQQMEEVTFLIGNKKKESFSLEIESIRLE